MAILKGEPTRESTVREQINERSDTMAILKGEPTRESTGREQINERMTELYKTVRMAILKGEPTRESTGREQINETSDTMAILKGEPTRESTVREQINERMTELYKTVRDVLETSLRLRENLLGSSPTGRDRNAPAHPGWMGELLDGLEVIQDCVLQTRDALAELERETVPIDVVSIALPLQVGFSVERRQ